jgi:hypothetical protein
VTLVLLPLADLFVCPHSSNLPVAPCLRQSTAPCLARSHDNCLVSGNASPSGKIMKNSMLKGSFVGGNNQGLPIGPGLTQSLGP